MAKKVNYRYNIGETIEDDSRSLTVKDRWFEPRQRGKNIVNIKYYNLQCNKCGKELIKKEESSLYNHHAGCLSCKNQKEFLREIGEIIKDDNRDFTVLNRFRKIENTGHGRKAARKYYTLQCNICGAVQEKSESNLSSGQGCKEKHMIAPHGEYIINARPDLVKYFVDQNIPKQFGTGSSLDVELQCPICGFKKHKQINYICSFGFACPRCSDGFSYPQKFLYSMLNQLNIDYTPEYAPEWANGRKYDALFLSNSVQYVVETDGGFHFEDNRMNGLTAEEAQKIDEEKDHLAEERGFKPIRIDCRISNKEYIINNIINSDFNHIFDLSLVNWDQCDIDASKSIFLELCKYYDEHRNITVPELCVLFKISNSTVWKYLKRGKEYGFCPSYKTRYDIRDEKYLQAIQLYIDYPEMKLKEIAKRIGRSKDTLTRYLKRGSEEGLIKYIPHPQKRI